MAQIVLMKKGDAETLVMPTPKGAVEIKMPKAASKEEKVEALTKAIEFLNQRK